MIKNITNILIVDDMPHNIISLENILQEDDVIIHKAYSGFEALELLLLHDFALAILDVQMPEMNGFELAELMRGKEKTKNIPIIFVTAGAINSRYTFMGYDVGAVDFLYKPLDIVVVKSKVKVFKELEIQKQIIKNQLNQLSQALKWRDEFLAIASHELKTPLTTLTLQNQMALIKLEKEDEKILDGDKLRKIFTKSGKQLEKLNHLIEDLLDTTRIREGKLTLAPVNTDFSSLIRNVIDRYSDHLTDMKSLQLNIQESVYVYCDSFRMEQVLINLLSNATKYAPNTDLKINLLTEDDKVIFQISDEGPGIPDDKLGSIFERFNRGTHSEHVSGLGLGLYIVKQIIDAHEGQISVESDLDRGTAFTIAFPEAQLH